MRQCDCESVIKYSRHLKCKYSFEAYPTFAIRFPISSSVCTRSVPVRCQKPLACDDSDQTCAISAPSDTALCQVTSHLSRDVTVSSDVTLSNDVTISSDASLWNRQLA